MIAAGLPAGAIRADTMMLVLSTFVGLLFGAAFGADLADGFIDDVLDFIEVGIGIARPDVLNISLQHAPADSLFDEFRKVLFFCALAAEKGAQGQICVPRDPDAPARL